MPSFTDAERAAWRAANADLIEFIQTPANQRASRFVASMAASFAAYNSLTVPQTNATRNVMRELAGERTDDINIARADDESPIPNGVFTVNDGTEHLTYRIHSVRNGRLQGQRVIKRQLAYGEFKAFAFLTRQGTVKVWRSFYEDEARNERYIAWARILVEALRERTQDVVEPDETSDFEFTYASGNGYSIQASVLCRRCNRALTDPTSIRLNIGPECRNREQTARTNAANAHEPVDIAPGGVMPPTLGLRIPEGEVPTVRFLTDPEPFPFEEVGVRVVSGEQESPIIPVSDREARLMDAAQRAIDGHCRMNYITRVRSCEYCGRDDFQSPQGRGRHVSSCRTNYRRQTRMERALRALGEYRAEAGIVRSDDYAMRYSTMVGQPAPAQQPAYSIRRAARRPVMSGAPVPTVTRPHLSQLGTVIGGVIWEQ